MERLSKSTGVVAVLDREYLLSFISHFVVLHACVLDILVYKYVLHLFSDRLDRKHLELASLKTKSLVISITV